MAHLINPQFFVKHAGSFSNYDALALMHNKIECAMEKCKEEDDTYIKELACLTEMIKDYWEAKGIIDYRTLL
jgi:hypothetical protein